MAKIEYLGKLSETCGRVQDISLPQSITDVAALRSWLNTTFEENPLASPSIRVIVNDEVVTETRTISNTDTIAFFPPVGGG